MARILHVSGKTSDHCCTELKIDGKTVKETDGYVPKIMPENGGDYITLEIDIDTGQLLNWKKPSEAKLEEYLESEE